MLLLILNLGLVSADSTTIIIGQNATPPVNLIQDNSTVFSNGESVTNKTINVLNASKADLDNLAVSINTAVDELIQYSVYLEAKENRTDKQINLLSGVLGELKDEREGLKADLRTEKKKNEEYDTRLLTLENERNKLKYQFPVVALVGLLIGVIGANIATLFRKSNKMYMLIRWVRSWWPFVVGSPDIEELASDKKPKVFTTIVFILILIIVVGVFLL